MQAKSLLETLQVRHIINRHSMLLLNMIALLAYSLLERQVRRLGLQLTFRQLIQRLETLTLIETHCRDDFLLRRLAPCFGPFFRPISQENCRFCSLASLLSIGKVRNLG